MNIMEEIKIAQRRLLDMALAVCSLLEREKIPYWISDGILLGAVRHQGWIPWDDDFDMILTNDSYIEALKLLQHDLPNNMFVEYFDTEPLYFHAWAHVKDLNSECRSRVSPQDSCYSHKGLTIDLYKVHRMQSKDILSFKIKEYIMYLERRYKHGLIDETDYHKRIKKLENEDTAKQMIRIDDDPNAEPTAIVYTGAERSIFYEDRLFPLVEYKFEEASFWGPNNSDDYLRRFYGDYMTLPPIEKRVPGLEFIKL